MRDESRVLVDVAGGFVVLGVGKSPRVERDEEEGVHDKTHRPIQSLVLRERAVATLVCEDPDTGEDKTLNSGVCRPCRESKIGVREERDEGDGEVDQHGEVAIIADDVGHGSKDGWLEAVGWDGIVDFFHGEGRKFEGIAMEIHVLGLWHR